MANPAGPITESVPMKLLPAVIGIAITGAFLVLLAYLASRRSAQEQSVPRLVISTPASGSAADSPLVVRFTSSAIVRLQQSGWGARSLHLHAWVGDRQLMPGAADIKGIDQQTYEWTMPLVRRAPEQQIHIGWADAAHRPIAAGRSSGVTVTVQ